jgi:hypothetical protein
MNAENLLARIDVMVAELSKPVSAGDRRDGWTDASRDVMHAFFQQMRADVVAGRDVSKVPHYVGVVRGLDHWGISGGRLFEEAAALGRMVKDSA